MATLAERFPMTIAGASAIDADELFDRSIRLL
jgi:hypothetical protein